jgi:hypothetical protein
LPNTFKSSHLDHDGNLEFRVTSAYLLTEILGIPVPQQHNTFSKRLADVMRGLGWKLAENSIRIGNSTQTYRAYTKPQPLERK